MPVINMEQTGKQIAELRKNANLTVNDIKEELALTTVKCCIQVAAWTDAFDTRQSETMKKSL